MTGQSDPPIPGLASEILAWTEGWARSRQVQPPTPIQDGVALHVGTLTESGRYVLTVTDSDRARALTSEVRTTNFWIKWPAAPHEDEPWMPKGWKIVERQFLMATHLVPSSPPLPSGYRLEIQEGDGAVEVRVLTDAGSVAARGRVGMTEIAVPDQIVTQDAHMRRGLGRVVMSTLCNAAMEGGRSDAVLLASAQGRHLYDDLGWRLLTPFWAAFHGE